MKSNLELPRATIKEIQDRAYMCVLFTGMLTKDVHSVKSKMLFSYNVRMKIVLVTLISDWKLAKMIELGSMEKN